MSHAATIRRSPTAQIAANLAAIATAQQLITEARAATEPELDVLLSYRSWGASGVANIFDERSSSLGPARAELAAALDPDSFTAARRTVLNAHFTHPEIAAAMWRLAQQLGFDQGTVLEPGCGSGIFATTAPDAAHITGIEMDPTTAQIAQLINPAATIRAESFTDTPIGAQFDLVIGNVPFDSTIPHDPISNPHRELSLHNYFLVKSLRMTAPGGLVIALTSRWTMDAQNPAARRALAEYGDLVTAVRLPSGAHHALAGTQALTDLLILRRRDPNTAPDPATAQLLAPVVPIVVPDRDGNDTETRIHPYFVHHPQQVLGHLGTGRGLYGNDDLIVRADNLEPAKIAADIDTLNIAATTPAHLRWNPQHATSNTIAAAPQIRGIEGHLERVGSEFHVLENGQLIPVTVPKAQHRELAALLELRDLTVHQLQGEAATEHDTTELAQTRTKLNRAYDTYMRHYGPLNRCNLTATSRIDTDTGEPIVQRRIPPVMHTFRQDPHAATVFALEVFDDSTQTATKAGIFHQRVVVKRSPRHGAETTADAIAICLDTHGRINLDTVAQLLGVDTDTALTACAGEIFLDPGSQQWLTKAEYLSGNIRHKIIAVEQADDPRYHINLTALREVLPTPLGPAEITVQLGAAWVPAEDVQAFLRETLDDRWLNVIHSSGSDWKIKNGKEWGVLATSTFGTDRMPAPKIAENLLTQRPIQVHDTVELFEGTRQVLNPTETLSAQEKAEQLQEAFAEWVWSNPERANRFADLYNDKFNSLVLRSYDGTHLQFPGLAATFTPRPHQRAAVARMVSEPAVGLFHEVGAGKTAEMVMGCMELRRLGMVTKPAVVVPNHMLEQFQREWLQLYPAARLLAASTDDLAKDKRQQFTARAATGDWDGIILTQGSFQRLAVSHDTIRDYSDSEGQRLRQQLQTYKDNGISVKSLERRIAKFEERLKAQLDVPRDPGITFEETGIDYVCIDEAHMYKNLTTPSSIQGAGIAVGSRRATDLDMKLHYLRGRHGDRVVTAATATPIANSMVEAYVMQRYLRPDLLTDAGIDDFDSWAGTFGQVVPALETTAAGTLKLKSRFAKFVNVPELLRMMHVAADIKTAEDLNLPTPDLRTQPDGHRGPETVLVPRSEQLAVYMEWLGKRTEDLQGKRTNEKGADNILVVTSDGRKAALDLRLLPDKEQQHIRDAGYTLTDVAGKLDAAADRIAHIWREHQNDEFLDPAGNVSPRLGALQLVFSDLGTPSDKWNAYDELADGLAARGMPRSQIRYIHDATNDTEKARLFAACRTGEVAVLIGSTQKMGVGTNVQDRAVALHHLDCPWRPADLAQRDGRVVRQGNQNKEIEVIRYVTEQSFDAALWSTIARKATFIGQVMRGKLDVREMDDIGDVALDAAQVAASITGDDRLLIRAKLEMDVNRLERLQRAHHRNDEMLTQRIKELDQRIPHLQIGLQIQQGLCDTIVPTSADQFVMSIGTRRYHGRPEAAAALTALVTSWIRSDPYASNTGELHRDPITLGGITFSLQRCQPGTNQNPGTALVARLTPAGLTQHGPWVDVSKQAHWDGMTGTITRLENAVARLPKVANETAELIEQLHIERDRATAQHGTPFKHQQQLENKRRELAELMRVLTEEAASHPATTDDAATAARLHAQHHPRPATSQPVTPPPAKNRRDQEMTKGNDDEHQR